MMAKKAEDKKSAKVLDQITEPMKKAGKAVKDTAAKVGANTAAVNVKVIDHAEANAREAFAAMRAAASVGTVKDLVKIQSDYVKDQSKRSMDQAKEVGELIASFGRSAMESMRGK